MRKANNTEHVEGRIYEHTLDIKQVSNQSSANYGKEFITGELRIAVDEEGMNVIPVHFTYVTEETSSGKKNQTYVNLKKIIDENRTWLSVGKDDAQKVAVNTALGLNDFYAQDGSPVSTKQNEGGFVTLLNGDLALEEERNTFNMDMVITGTKLNEDGNMLTVKGAVFNFRNAILPVDFVVRNPEGIKYFEGLGASSSEPVYTNVWGKINNKTIVTKVEEESAFGEAAVKTTTRRTREWLITGTARNAYEFGDEKILTAEELSKAIQDRNVYLADVKKRAEDYRANKNASTSTASVQTAKPAATSGTFTF